MIYVTKFRANDLNPSKGKQIEFNSGVIENFFQFTTPQANAEFKCISLENPSIIRNVKVSFTLSPARGDYKVYQNADGSMDLKDFFLNTLHLTREANIDDYYAIRKTPADRYTLYYIPKSLIFSAFFEKISGDQIVYYDIPKDNEEETENNTAQVIYYGCPGTGKSFEVKRLTEKNYGAGVIYFNSETHERIPEDELPEDKNGLPSNIFRTTFHPDYDYATFVGSYKPSMEDKDGKSELTYTFVPQVFTKAYVRALRSKKDDTLVGAEKNVYLVIEEINRGNCAQIFGDLFQLLDRTAGKSDYAIVPDTELAKYLAKEGVPAEYLELPDNLHIYATMNTSDQSLFPMDSAFKRRWAMEYKSIDYDNEKASGYTITIGEKEYNWIEFLKAVNPLIQIATESEDKQMGEFFIRGNVSEQEFKNKVMFYLWNDVCKDYYSPSRTPSRKYFLRVSKKIQPEREGTFTFTDLFAANGKGTSLLIGFMDNLLNPETEDKADNGTQTTDAPAQ